MKWFVVCSLSVTCASDELFNWPLLFEKRITLSIILINLPPVDIAFPEPYLLDSALSSGYDIFIQCLNSPGLDQCQLLVQ